MHNGRSATCPNCDYDCESEGYDSKWSYSQEENVETWSYTCDRCGCEFEFHITEKTTYEEDTETIKEGKQLTAEEIQKFDEEN
jgi:hypothetical protein